jgi:protein TonB
VRGFLGIVAAVILHAAFLTFGGLLLPEANEEHATLQEVELVGPQAEQQEPQPPEPAPDEPPPPPESDEAAAAAALEDADAQPAVIPALDAASLGALEDALFGRGGAGDFATSLDFASGGRIGGTGKPGSGEDELERAFSLAEVDQRARPLFQTQPLYPAELRSRKVEGTVTLVCVVDANGKVVEPRIEKSSHAAFERPALDAFRQWKFEPAIRSGQRVASRVRQPIRFKVPNL